MRRLDENATLVERIDLTPALALFRVAPDEPLAPGWFTAGQFCALGLNNDDEPARGPVRRSMSIASAPEDPGPLEFYIRRVANPESANPFTHLLWRKRPGERIFMQRAAAGAFTLAGTCGVDDPRRKVLVAAGTGSAPFVSMVRSAVRRDPAVDLSGFALLHGVSYPDDLGHRAELEALAATHGLRYVPTVSRPQPGDGWAGDTGRVEALFSPERLPGLEARLGLPPGGFEPSRVAVLVCGLRGTIGATITHLCGRGFVPEPRRMREALGAPADARPGLFYEQYDSAPVIDLKDAALVAELRAALARALSTPPAEGRA